MGSAGSACAFEADVHYGLTQWLALQAGFNPAQAEAIATGNNRVDSGDMQFIDLGFDYGCLAPDPEGSATVARHHYPSGGTIPGAPAQRAVVAGDAAAMRGVDDVMKAPRSHAGLMLFKLGQGLHALQDSWSHQGVPEVPEIPDRLFACDANLGWGHPNARGGATSHRADLTMHWPSDTIAMARATYEALTHYPQINAQRSPKPWTEIRSLLDGFVKAATKSEKRAWFVSNGIANVEFLEGTSLRDGTQPFTLVWIGRRLPRLPSAQSRQHYVDAQVLDFFSRFLADWMTTDDLDALATANVAPPTAHGNGGSFVPLDKRELAAQLKLWRMRDHGAAADLAHASRRLSARQLATVEALAKAPDALIRYASATSAFFPLVTKGKDASPLLPFIVAARPASDRGPRRFVATAKLRHAPYDTLAVVAELIDGRFRVISIASFVDH